ncbi:MAG: hypothetical protein LBB78_00360 [Spirochaetaceae bacterium]|nr:hypothetical protein [Spirochaetaceae bacterium]
MTTKKLKTRTHPKPRLVLELALKEAADSPFLLDLRQYFQKLTLWKHPIILLTMNKSIFKIPDSKWPGRAALVSRERPGPWAVFPKPFSKTTEFWD